MGEPAVVGVSGLSGHGADCARSYEARGPYNRYSSTSNVSAGRYEGESGKGRNEKRIGMKNETGETWRGSLLYLIAERMKSHWHERLRR